MNTYPISQTQTEFSIHPQTLLGHVSLTVSNLDNQIAFYQQALGFQQHWRDGNRAGLGAGGADLLRLTEEPNVKRYRRVTGLYHFAVVFPNQRELARAVARLFVLKYPNSPTDHIMTKTTYLDDLEGNGIELYAESPEDGTWSLKDGQYITRRKDGTLSDGREALDLDELFSHLAENENLDVPISPDARIGYHHHIGLNTWQGQGAPPPPADALGLRHFTVELPDQSALEDVIARVDAAGLPSNMTEDGLLVHDPSQNGVVLRVGGK